VDELPAVTRWNFDLFGGGSSTGNLPARTSARGQSPEIKILGSAAISSIWHQYGHHICCGRRTLMTTR
jgi:hypothetical protein